MYRNLLRAGFAATALLVAACSGDSPSDPGPLPAQYGSLVVTVSGLPTGASANVTVTGPGGFSRTISATTTLTQLSAGAYTVDASDVTLDGSTYSGAPATQTYQVAAGATVTTPNVSYAIATGGLSVTLAGLPQATTAAIIISGPESYSRTLAAATDIVGLIPGTYLIEAREVQAPNARYAATLSTQQVVVVASPAPAVAHVVYALSSGSLQLNISGLPQGVNANVSVRGPAGYSVTFSAETVIDNLTPGTYTVTGLDVVSGSLFQASPSSQQVVVEASLQAAVVNVIYISTGTSLNVVVNGLPSGVNGAVTVSGPNGYTKQLTTSQLLTGVAPGSYTVTASVLALTCTTFSPSPPSQMVTVIAGQSTNATITYATGGGGVNLCIDGAYITQAVQSYDNLVPLIAGRNALLRVFVKASVTNSAQPSVRARFYNQGGTLISTMTITPPTASVPTAIDEATLGSSWNAQLSGSFMQPGMRMLLDVDPTNAITEANESDNHFPAGGTPVALDVRVVAPLNVTIVPVIQVARGDTARVSEANKANFILPMQRMFPVATVNAEIRTPYTYSGAELQSGGGNWIGLLSEINAVRVAEATGSMYYGMVRVGYNSGVAGLGYIGVPAALGWDHQPSGTEVMAHELGHNFGRLHAPCGNPAGVDGAFPYQAAQISMFGYDIFSGQLKSSTLRDLMSYCDPPWISDYTYNGILNFRASNPMVVSARTAGATKKGLLVWGRIEQGRLVLEPSIEVDAPPTLPARGGSHRVEGFGPSGETLFSLSFNGDRVADAPDPNDQTFAFVVPMSQLRGVALNHLRFSALGRQVEQRGSGGGAVPAAQRSAPGRVRVSWNAASARVALVRDARNGQILTIARGGVVELQTPSDDLEITVSDGVKSTKSRIRPK
jgi:peptidase M66-like protein